MRKTTSGFTIIELVAVITVIAILTALGVYSFGRVQASTRDSQRSSKITLIAEALEKFYNQNGEYPSCYAMSQSAATITASTLKGLRIDALATPTAASGANSFVYDCGDMATGYTSDNFAYVGINSSTGSTNCLSLTTPEPCLQWTLKYREEATGSIIPLASRHLAP